MHLRFYLRGINTQCELWKIMAQAQFLKWRRIDRETNEEFEVLYQMALRPSVLGTWELVFPEECLPTVLAMLKYTEDNQSKKDKLRLAVLRKLCGTSKVPRKAIKESYKIPQTILIKDDERGISPLLITGTSVHVIGIERDGRGEMYDSINRKTYIQEYL